jgi:hypothetical protein
MKRNAKKVVVLAAAAGGFGVAAVCSSTAQASLLSTLYPTAVVTTVYSDSFTGGTAGTQILGNNPAVETGQDGGSASTAWLGTPSGGTPTSAADAIWNYSASGASITSPSANIQVTGANSGEDTATIANLSLPVTPVLGITYDLEATITVPSIAGATSSGTSGGHGLEMAYLYNSGNGHVTGSVTADAISNNDPVGLILDRDYFSPSTQTSTFFDIFEGSGTSNDTHFGNSSSPSTGGSVGTTITVDILFTATGATTGTESWYIDGNPVAGNPVAVTGLTSGVGYIQIGDNQTTGDLIQNFSLTAVPEPASAGLLAASGFSLMVRRRRKHTS